MSADQEILLDIKQGWGENETRLTLNQYPQLKECFLTISKMTRAEEYITFHMQFGEMMELKTALDRAIQNYAKAKGGPEF